MNRKLTERVVRDLRLLSLSILSLAQTGTSVALGGQLSLPTELHSGQIRISVKPTTITFVAGGYAHRLSLPKGFVNRQAQLADGNLLAVAAGNPVSLRSLVGVFDISSARNKVQWKEDGIVEQMSVKDGVLLYEVSFTASNYQTKVIDLATLKQRRQFAGKSVAKSYHDILYVSYGVTSQDELEQGETFLRYTPSRDLLTTLHFNATIRNNCGTPHLVPGRAPSRYTSGYVDIVRRDNCGPFATRYGWQEGASRKPTVLPLK